MQARWRNHLLASLVTMVGLASILLVWMAFDRNPTPLVAAQGAVRYVAIGGNDVGGCTEPGAPCRTVQYAVDVASGGDDILVASGVYTGVQARPAPSGYPAPPPGGVITQVVFITKSLTLRGGYTTTNWLVSDPAANASTLDAGGQGRVLVVAGSITPTVEGLRFTGGNASGLRGDPQYAQHDPYFPDYGGGVYVLQSAATFRENVVSSNVAHVGGGLFLNNSPSSLVSNTVRANSVSYGPGNWGAEGGGVYLYDNYPSLISNTLASNSALRGGGGLYAYRSSPTLVGNTVVSNSLSGGSGAGLTLNTTWARLEDNVVEYNRDANFGAGIYIDGGAPLLERNTIRFNTGRTAGVSNGAGVHIYLSGAVLRENTILGNVARGSGGGVAAESGPATLVANLIMSNTATTGQGGGVALGGGSSRMERNTILSNTAARGGGVSGGEGAAPLIGNVIRGNVATGAESYDGGGGVYLPYPATLINNVVADNQAKTQGGGAYIGARGGVRLLNTTVARNSAGDGSGVYLSTYPYPSSLETVFSNTIILSHTIGVRNGGTGNTVSMYQTLWDGNVADLMGMVTELGHLTGTVAFAGDGYHLTAASAAIDQGLNTSYETDTDGEMRTMGPFPDLGADEYPYLADLSVAKARQGEGTATSGVPITYFITITNAGPASPVNVRLVDVASPVSALAGLSASAPGDDCQSATGTITCTLHNVATDAVRLVTVVLTPTGTYSGAIANTSSVIPTNGIEVDGANNATAPVTTTVIYAPPTPDLEVSLKGPAYAEPGQTITYTVDLINRGTRPAENVVLTVTLPASVTFVSATGNYTLITRTLVSHAGAGTTVVPHEARPAGALFNDLTKWEVDEVELGRPFREQLAVRSERHAPDGAVLTYTAHVSTATKGDQPLNNTATFTTAIYQQVASVQLVNQSAVTSTLVGSDLLYSLVLSNTGLAPLNPRLYGPVPRGTAYLADSVWASYGEVGYNPQTNQVEWSGAGNYLAPGESAEVHYGVQVAACGGEEAGLLRNRVRVAEETYPYVDFLSDFQTLVRCADLRVRVEAPPVVHLIQKQGDAYQAVITYMNARQVDQRGDRSLAATGRLTATLVDMAEFSSADGDIDPPPTERPSPRQLVWDLGRLEPGAPGSIRVTVVEEPPYITEYQIMAAISGNPSEECERCYDDNRSNGTTYPLTMSFLKNFGEPHIRRSQDDSKWPVSVYVDIWLRYAYANTNPERPRAVGLAIHDLLPQELLFDRYSSNPEMDLTRSSGITGLLWTKAGYLQTGDGGHVRVRAVGPAMALYPGSVITNTAAAVFAVANAGTFTETDVAKLTVPLAPPVITEPAGSGEMCPGEVTFRGLAQPGTRVGLARSGYGDISPDTEGWVDSKGVFSVTIPVDSESTWVINAWAYFKVDGRLFYSGASNYVTLDVKRLPWCPSRSYWTGTPKAGPLEGRQVTFYFRDANGNFSTRNWQMPGLYGFWDTQLYLYGCGCNTVTATQTFTVTADGVNYGQSGDGQPQMFRFDIASSHDVRIAKSCSDDPSPPQVSAGQVLIDPDGYVFDVAKGLRVISTTVEGTPLYTNTLPGITVTAMVSMPQWGGWVPWPAQLYDNQTNPQVTGPDGYFAFFTPPGLYYLQVDRKEGYQSWRSPEIQVITQIVHVNVPLTPQPAGNGYTVTLSPDGLSPPVLTVPVGCAVAWVSTLSNTATISDIIRFTENPVLRPLSALNPLSNTLGFDGGYLEPGQVYRRQFTREGSYGYTDGLGRSGLVVVQPWRVYLPVVTRGYGP